MEQREIVAGQRVCIWHEPSCFYRVGQIASTRHFLDQLLSFTIKWDDAEMNDYHWSYYAAHIFQELP